jgi:putative DeoR family transcriptional regulator (stage III sporulation protein D)
MRETIEQRARELAVYIIEHKATVRAAAKEFGISKSTVHKDMTDRLQYIDGGLYGQVQAVLQKNKAERHIRGGDATRQKYKRYG